jgi:hypothetical protein
LRVHAGHLRRVRRLPLLGRADRIDAWSAFADEERICFGSKCEEASMAIAGAKEHLCQHAWGAFSTAECQ